MVSGLCSQTQVNPTFRTKDKPTEEDPVLYSVLAAQLRQEVCDSLCSTPAAQANSVAPRLPLSVAKHDAGKQRSPLASGTDILRLGVRQHQVTLYVK